MNMKSKKNLKDREKRKSSGQENDRGPSSKDTKHYASINTESVFTYIEQITCDGESTNVLISKEVCNMLKEDINYKLRHILQDALMKARVCGCNIIESNHIAETFKNFRIDKIYGAPSNPNWVPFGDQNLLYLDDMKVNLIDIAEEENTYAQHGNVSINKNWVLTYEDPNQSPVFRNYFITMCHAVINNDEVVRKVALKDISDNPQIGPIMEWFYHFGYFLLMKDVTYDSFSLFALDLIETLENSPLGSTNVSVRQLKLLVRLLLQRLLIAVVSKDVLKPMCSTLALLCLRESLKQMVIIKINQKLGLMDGNVILPVLTAIYFLGIDAIKSIFLPNMKYFISKIDLNIPEIVDILLAIYGLVCKTDSFIISCPIEAGSKKMELDFVTMKTQLVRTRRKVDCNIIKKPKIELETVFEIPAHSCRIREEIIQHRNNLGKYRKETHVIVGKNSLLLSVLNGESEKRSAKKCTGHWLPYYF